MELLGRGNRLKREMPSVLNPLSGDKLENCFRFQNWFSDLTRDINLNSSESSRENVPVEFASRFREPSGDRRCVAESLVWSLRRLHNNTLAMKRRWIGRDANASWKHENRVEIYWKTSRSPNLAFLDFLFLSHARWTRKLTQHCPSNCLNPSDTAHSTW